MFVKFRMENLLAAIILLLIHSALFAQTKPCNLAATKTTHSIKIDGVLDDEAWKTAPVAHNFIEQRPTFGRSEDEATRTEAFMLYDNDAVYVAIYCHERSRDSIATELAGRDQMGINDFAGVMFDSYMDKINGVGFYVTPLGEQYDCKYSLGNEDDGWNTVYQTATTIKNDGWICEMRIPYSALRFSKEKVQNWGVNFVRRRSKTGQQVTWSPLDPNKFGLLNQAGVWSGLEDIKAPIRLSFSPYFSTYANKTADTKWNATVNGGMDVKYGISKSFTLDMTLIPDFGQVQSDNQVLNLSPFEVRFNENRAFFTEGTELFNKGNLFYSRRIGGQPLNYSLPASQLKEGETILKNPSETKLLNATKISGRTAKGFGIGFFNALVKPQNALIETGNKEQYKIETNPLTNYNILVLDQTMKNNSSVSLVNTSVWRSGKDYDANVTAALWDLYDNNISWNAWGKIANSRLFNHTPGQTTSGYNHELNIGKFRGPLNFEIHNFLADQNYQQNDMGFFTNNNYYNYGASAWYKLMKPKSFYNNIRFNWNATYSQRFKPRSYQYFSMNTSVNSQLKNLWSVNINGSLVARQQDFYEARSEGRVFRSPAYFKVGFSVSSNTAKKYAGTLQFTQKTAPEYKLAGSYIYFNNRYRFNDKLSLSLDNNLEFVRRDAGYAYEDTVLKEINFGLRDRTTVENILNLKYNFNIKMGLSFRARHYWSEVCYKRFFKLEEKGNLDEITTVNQNPNKNLNLFNIDMVYTWEFAPGSFVNIAWKDASFLSNQITEDSYQTNFSKILRTSQENNFSVKVIYYLDYLTLRRKRN